jgi:hypothetical protein
MELSRANDLLNPGYLPFESGYRDLADGKRLVAALTRMPGCRAKMVHWWFSWLGGTEQYKLWHPRDHVFSHWQNRHDGQLHRRLASGARISRRPERTAVKAAHQLSRSGGDA